MPKSIQSVGKLKTQCRKRGPHDGPTSRPVSTRPLQSHARVCVGVVGTTQLKKTKKEEGRPKPRPRLGADRGAGVARSQGVGDRGSIIARHRILACLDRPIFASTTKSQNRKDHFSEIGRYTFRRSTKSYCSLSAVVVGQAPVCPMRSMFGPRITASLF